MSRYHVVAYKDLPWNNQDKLCARCGLNFGRHIGSDCPDGEGSFSTTMRRTIKKPNRDGGYLCNTEDIIRGIKKSFIAQKQQENNRIIMKYLQREILPFLKYVDKNMSEQHYCEAHGYLTQVISKINAGISDSKKNIIKKNK